LQFNSNHFDALSVFFFMIFIGTSIAMALDSLAKGFGTTIFFRMTLMEPGVVCSVPKPGAMTGSAKTGSVKTGSAKTGAAKTGSAKTGSKTGSKTGAAKTGAAKTGAAKTGSKTGAAKTGSKTGAAKTGAETVFVFFRFVVGGVAFAGA
jgi:hypothetical protein